MQFYVILHSMESILTLESVLYYSAQSRSLPSKTFRWHPVLWVPFVFKILNQNF